MNVPDVEAGVAEDVDPDVNVKVWAYCPPPCAAYVPPLAGIVG